MSTTSTPRATRPAPSTSRCDENGVTGHPDHRRATEAARAVASRDGIDVLAWSLPADVAAALNAEFDTCFGGRSAVDMAARIDVDRRRQLRAIRCHASQATANPVLWRRLELLGDGEWLRRVGPANAAI